MRAKRRRMTHARPQPDAHIQGGMVLEVSSDPRQVCMDGEPQLLQVARVADARSDQQQRRCQRPGGYDDLARQQAPCIRSEEHTSELQSLMRISYAVFCLKNKKKTQN